MGILLNSQKFEVNTVVVEKKLKSNGKKRKISQISE